VAAAGETLTLGQLTSVALHHHMADTTVIVNRCIQAKVNRPSNTDLSDQFHQSKP